MEGGRVGGGMFTSTNVPNATLADVASWLIQKDTQDSITISIDGKYV